MASIVEDTVVNYELAKTNYNHLGQPLDTLLKITIHSASGLKDVDFMGKSDPYVTLQKFNGCVIQGPWSKKELPACGTARGRVIKDNCDPIFEEDYYFLMEEKVTRCKLVIKDEDIGTDASIGTQILNFHSGMEGGEEIKLVPQGTCKFTFKRVPLYKALQMEESSNDDWGDKNKHPTRMKKVISLTVLQGSGLGDGKGRYYCKIDQFKNADGSDMRVDGGTKHSGDERGTKSKTSVHESGEGCPEFNETFVFLAPAENGEGAQR